LIYALLQTRAATFTKHIYSLDTLLADPHGYIGTRQPPRRITPTMVSLYLPDLPSYDFSGGEIT